MALLDEMIKYALEELLAGNPRRRRMLVRQMCQRWPEEPALELCFALTSAAAIIDDSFARESESDKSAYFAYKLAAIFASDVYAAERLTGRPARARDLLHFWRRVDPYFTDG